MPEKDNPKMNNEKEQYRKTLRLLLLSHWGLAVLIAGLCLILSFVLFRDLRQTALGALIGGAGGMILILSMSYSIERATDHDPQSAQKYMLKHYLVRTLLMLGLLLFGVFNGKWMLLGITLGLLCVKMGGFLEPKLERRLFNMKERRK